MLPREQKNFALRRARKPSTVKGLHNTVVIYGAEGIHYGYIGFSDALVAAVGCALPRGVSVFDPAHLFVTEGHEGWSISTRYILSSEERLLWSTRTFPVWLNSLKTVGEEHYAPRSTPSRALTCQRPAIPRNSDRYAA